MLAVDLDLHYSQEYGSATYVQFGYRACISAGLNASKDSTNGYGDKGSIAADHGLLSSRFEWDLLTLRRRRVSLRSKSPEDSYDRSMTF